MYQKGLVHMRPPYFHLKTAVQYLLQSIPVTKPNLKVIKRDEHNLDDCIDELMRVALETTEKVYVEAE